MKKILLSLGLITLGSINFSNGINLDWIDTFIATGTFTVPTITANYGFTSVYDTNNTDFKNYCIYIDNVSSYGDIIIRYDASSTRTASSTIQGGYLLESAFSSNFSDDFNIFCTNGTRRYYGFSYPKANAGLTFDYYIFDSTQLNNKIINLEQNINSCSGYLNQCQSDLGDCQNSSCRSELTQCENDFSSCSNSLGTCGTQLNSCNTALGNCMQGNVGTGINWSSLFINGIQHVGKPLINITIPEEINWDYVNSGTVFDLTVSGYNQDSDYIEGLINIQNVKPSNEDLNKIISEIIPLFVPGLLIILFIYFVFRFIKKIF